MLTYRAMANVSRQMLFGSLVATRLSFAYAEPQAPTLVGTSWQLVKFQGSNDSTLVPDERSKYTITFGPGGKLEARIDCNRGRGTWTSRSPSQLEFGPLALTRAMCPPGSLHDQLVKQLPFVRSYVLRGSHLFLALMADGGIYEFEPISPTRGKAAQGKVRGTATYRERMALPPNALLEVTLEDVSKADNRAELIARVRNERPGNPPIPFVISYDPGRIIPNHYYTVRARILVDSKPLFVTEQGYPVLTGAADTALTLMLRHVGSSAAQNQGISAPPSAAEGKYWKLTQLAGAPVAAPSQQEQPY